MGNDSEINDLLLKLGLSEDEGKIISYLTENADVSVSEVSQKLGISRSTIYRHLQNLEDKGWIQYILTNQGKNIRLADLSSLSWIIEEQKSELEKREKAFESLLTKAKDLINKEDTPLKVRYFEGRGGLRQTYWNLQKS